MIPVFSFKKSIAANILECVGVLFPGIQKAIAYSYVKDAHDIIAYEYLHDKDAVIEIDSGKYKIDVGKERRVEGSYTWVNPKSIEEETKVQQQLGLYDEFENNILLIRIENTYDKLNDLLYLYMNKNMAVFQIEHNRSEISGREKTLLARTIVNNIHFLKKQMAQDKQLYTIYNQSVLLTRSKLSSTEKQLEEAQQNYAASIIAYCEHQILQIAKEIDKQVQLTPEALKLLSEYKGEFKDLETILKNSVIVAQNLNSTSGNDVLFIDKHDITFDVQIENQHTKHDLHAKEKFIIDRYSRTRELLNRYEAAAHIAKEKGLAVTGKNIGKFCQPSISAPAIADSLVNHQKKIITLLNDAPEKWPIIRNEFRSIINLQTKYNQKMAQLR